MTHSTASNDILKGESAEENYYHLHVYLCYLIVLSNCILELTTYTCYPQESSDRAHCGRVQCQTHCTASLERLVHSSGRVLCYKSDNASFLQCSICHQTLVCGKQRKDTLTQSGDCGYRLDRTCQMIKNNTVKV